jgi:hypothetical protein
VASLELGIGAHVYNQGALLQMSARGAKGDLALTPEQKERDDNRNGDEKNCPAHVL